MTPVQELNFLQPPDPNYKPWVILDSGAYTAWRQGHEITADEYADFIYQTNCEKLEAYINLDKINPGDPVDAAEESWKNYVRLKNRGLNPMPVFHRGEDMKYLYRMLDAGCDYVALSCTGGWATKSRLLWYDIVWNALVNSGGWPVVKVHGLADTNPISMKNYPWYSVDSSSWAQESGKTGNIVFYANGRKTFISTRKDGAHSKRVKDIESLQGEELAAFKEFLGKFGFDYAQLCERRPEDHVFRLYLGMNNFIDYMEGIKNRSPIKLPATPSLTGSLHRSTKPKVDIGPVKVYLASWLNPPMPRVFSEHDYPYVLLSYAHIKAYMEKHDGEYNFGLKVQEAKCA